MGLRGAVCMPTPEGAPLEDASGGRGGGVDRRPSLIVLYVNRDLENRGSRRGGPRASARKSKVLALVSWFQALRNQRAVLDDVVDGGGADAPAIACPGRCGTPGSSGP